MFSSFENISIYSSTAHLTPDKCQLGSATPLEGADPHLLV